MNLYTFLSIGYDLLDKIWLSEKGRNPRKVIEDILPDKKCKVLDMCCGTFTSGLSIAKKNPNNLVVGLDRSKPMLREGMRKVKKENLKNVKLVCRDALNTGIIDSTFDYVIIGLVLHECNPDLWAGILREAYRILKDNGHLIILEWEKAIDEHHASPMMKELAALREKYDLHMTVERYVSDVYEEDDKFLRK